MIKRNYLYFLLFVIVGGLIAYFTTPSRGEKANILDKDTIIVGTNAEYPPFAFMQENHIVGFDIDIAKDVCKRMGKELSLRDYPSFDALIPALITGKVDMLAAGMTYTPKRAEKVLFTRPYFVGDPFVIVSLKEENLATVQSLEGKTVAVNEGYTADEYLSSHANAKLIRLGSPADAFMAVKTKRVNAFVTAMSTVNLFLEKTKEGDFAIHPIPGTADQYSLVVAKGQEDFLEKLDDTLDAMKKDGVIEQLKKKWDLTNTVPESGS